jgi:hypothetical protein
MVHVSEVFFFRLFLVPVQAGAHKSNVARPSKCNPPRSLKHNLSCSNTLSHLWCVPNPPKIHNSIFIILRPELIRDLSASATHRPLGRRRGYSDNCLLLGTCAPSVNWRLDNCGVFGAWRIHYFLFITYFWNCLFVCIYNCIFFFYLWLLFFSVFTSRMAISL